MRSTVFTDGALGRQAGRFVWLALDTEKAVNAPFKKKYPVDALPTYFVVDAATETPVLRWMGGATVTQLQKLLDEGARAVSRRGSGLEEELAKADRLFAQAKDAEAATALRDLLAKAPKGWKPWARATESLLYALQRTGDAEGCARTARDAFGKLRATPSSANVAATGLDCALDLPADHPERNALVGELVRDARAVVSDPHPTTAGDDRAGVWEALVSERGDAKDEDGKKRVAAEWAAFLEKEAGNAKSPEARAIFDSWRVAAYIELGTPEKAVPMLEASERDMPDDYNPSARLAIAYKAMKAYDEALAASDRALARVYGPRKLTVLRTRADIYTAKGDPAAAKKTLEEALAIAEALPEGQRSDRTIAALRKKLEEVH
jgi:hypothetical protein